MSEHLDDPPPPATAPAEGSEVDGAPRDLTRRQLEVLAWLIDHGAPFDPDQRVVEEADRARWRAQLTAVRAGRSCGCGTCPSIELVHPAALRAAGADGHPVVEGSTAGAVLLLFADGGDHLSYLELAPTGEQIFGELPHPGDLHPT
ncbi:hypothetical protein [Kineococcus sp. SYSU DK006]|uniref:hypothetical protein n=1 Tax=Kineococcus sp. SYSU DK006 TaxID=3383127 RepID=UPI003D7C6962